MKGVIHFLFIHEGNQQPVSLDHDFGVTCFHWENEFMKVVGTSDTNKFEGRFGHTTWRVAESIHNAVWKGAVICANSHRSSEIFASKNKRREGFVETIEFFFVLRIAVFSNLKFFPVSIVPWINPDFFDMFYRFHCCLREKVNVCHDRDFDFCWAYSLGDFC